MRAYECLQNRDIILNKRGIGYFSAEDANEKIIAFRKERFFNQDLPLIFKTMQLLNIQIVELEEKYQFFINNQNIQQQ
jgi:DNA-binding transcriptional regulator YhcF (GntR family)